MIMLTPGICHIFQLVINVDADELLNDIKCKQQLNSSVSERYFAKFFRQKRFAAHFWAVFFFIVFDDFEEASDLDTYAVF